MIQVDNVYNGIKFNAMLKEGLTVLVDESGTGKTLFLRGMHWLINYKLGMSCVLLDYECVSLDLSQSTILNSCKDKDVVLIDNADIFMSEELLGQIILMAKYVLVSVKDYRMVCNFDNSFATVIYNNGRVTLEEH